MHMQRSTLHPTRLGLGLMGLMGLLSAAPLWAMSLATTGPSQPLPSITVDSATLAANDPWTAGSASLVPLMAADAPATQASGVTVPASNNTTRVGKPVDDIDFVRLATESSRKEVQSANEALPQLKQPELKTMAEMLARDHAAASAKLSRIAEAKGWPVPGPRTTAAPPAGTASSSFDATWTAEMIAGHERSVALYRAQAQGGEDKDLRKYARETLPTIEHHLAELRRLQK